MFPMKTESDPTSGGADHFLRFISEELIPFVDENYRTKSFRILSGMSNSAFFTIYALMENPTLFSAYIASSPTLLGWFENRLSEIFEERNKKNEGLNRILYLIYGENDFPSILKAIPGFSRIMEENAPKSFIWDIKLVRDEGHVPYNGLYEGLQFVFSDWRYPSGKLKESTFRDVKAYYDRLSEKYGYSVDIPAMVLADMGNELVRADRIEGALEVLKYNVKLYPANPMSHFYLGLAYERNSETALAVEHIAKAVELDPSWARAKRKLAELNKK
jgi:tetratricopeptide (TPR) repeat protein